MRKVIEQAFVSFAVFAAVLFCFSLVNWMSVFNYPSFTLEKVLGRTYEKFYLEQQEQITDDSVMTSLNILLTHICKENGINDSTIKLFCLKNEEVNAFAFPDRRLVINSGLLNACEDESELAGVMAHELAHIEERHVMKQLIKEVGVQILLSQALGGQGEVIIQTGQTLSSSAYSRSMEREADALAVTYLQKAHISTSGIANFFSRLAGSEENNPFFAAWISTHPESNERANNVQKLSETEDKDCKKILSGKQWQKIKQIDDETNDTDMQIIQADDIIDE